MLRKVPLVFALLVAALMVYTATRPAEFVLERSLHMAASPEAAFALINDFHHWRAFSPWEELDPDMLRTYGDVASGKGATYHWSGTEKVGEGTMTIVESSPPRHVGIVLEFIKPWAAKNRSDFTLEPDGSGVTVRWAMRGERDFVGKLFGLFLDMERVVGPDFEKGLAKLAKAAAAPSP